MKKAGYRLVFESEEAAAAARDQCDHTSRKTGWQEKAECGRNVVFVPNNTLLGEEDFHEEDCTEGDTLFQQICFLLAESFPGMPFDGSGRFEDTDGKVKVRMFVKHTEEYLRFLIRKNTPERMQHWTVSWYRRTDGSFEKSDYILYHEKSLQG